MPCVTHSDIVYRCEGCGEGVILHQIETPYDQAVMVHNLAMGLRDRRKRKDGYKYVAVANRYARWLEVKKGTNG